MPMVGNQEETGEDWRKVWLLWLFYLSIIHSHQGPRFDPKWRYLKCSAGGRSRHSVDGWASGKNDAWIVATSKFCTNIISWRTRQSEWSTNLIFELAIWVLLRCDNEIVLLQCCGFDERRTKVSRKFTVPTTRSIYNFPSRVKHLQQKYYSESDTNCDKDIESSICTASSCIRTQSKPPPSTEGSIIHEKWVHSFVTGWVSSQVWTFLRYCRDPLQSFHIFVRHSFLSTLSSNIARTPPISGILPFFRAVSQCVVVHVSISLSWLVTVRKSVDASTTADLRSFSIRRIESGEQKVR